MNSAIATLRLWQAYALAYSMKRYLVLPRTMNCANCPAARGFGPWNFSRCTVDYFANIGAFNRGYQTVEAGIQDLPWFAQLKRALVPAGGAGKQTESVHV